MKAVTSLLHFMGSCTPYVHHLYTYNKDCTITRHPPDKYPEQYVHLYKYSLLRYFINVLKKDT